ncbi:hypothetical protein C8P63_11712 [Melghirimyces profundicolus]|uniref:Uncharacterized protein n=1 Tax=Melghirimyces profundicolus TaxID=1242148 RepID=A0A2T6BQA1_9BACL|nr:hypothetical protein [Melghirimyces profundicolus]PTX58265.1 hypothetical protein C8P63_11712 [Melghirimyces profundicolus]
MIRFPSAVLFVGGYEQEEQQPDPFVALNFEREEEAKGAARWLSETAGSLLTRIDPEPGGDLRVTVCSGSGETVCEGIVWEDEMWTIFREYFGQGETVWLGVSVGGSFLPEGWHRLPKEAVTIAL